MVRVSSIQIVLLCVALTVTALPASAAQPQVPVNNYIVQVSQFTNASQLAQGAAQRLNGALGHVYSTALNGFSIRLPAGLAARDILNLPGVVRVEPDVRVYAVAQTLPKGIDRIDVDQHGTIRIDGVDDRLDVDIAIIDTGIDTDHPDLRVVGGRHFYSSSTGRAYQDDRYDDDNGHGSHVAGISAAIDNNIGVVGIAPGARLWAVKVLDSRGSGYVSDLIAGIDWVTARAGTIEVVNMSLAATGRSDILRTAIQNSVAAGVVHVAAAGNSSKDIYGLDRTFNTNDDTIPAAYPEVATISAMADSDGKPGGSGASTSYGVDDSFASFSNFSAGVVSGNPVRSPGAGIDLLMPGVNIYSCWRGGGYNSISGTSMASPHGAGLVALYIADHGRASNAAGVYAIRQALIDAGMNQASGKRLIPSAAEPDRNLENLGWAGETGPTDDAPTATIVQPADGSTVSGTVTVQVRATDAQDPASRLTVQVSIDAGDPRTAAYNAGNGYHELAWDTTTVAGGEHRITASATDTAGNTSNAAQVRVTVGTGNSAPTVAIVNPADGDLVAGRVTVQVQASDDHDATGALIVDIRIDSGTSRRGAYNPSTGYYELSWDTTSVGNGSHTIDARAADSSNNAADAPGIAVTVRNEAATPTMHVASIEIRMTTFGPGWPRVIGEVRIVDSQGAPVEGALVTGTFSGDISGRKMRVTNASGLATLDAMAWRPVAPRVTLCVDDVAHYLSQYEPADNEETCDSND
jgi:subtilisin